MRRIGALIWVMMVLELLTEFPLWADVPEFTPRITDVTVFKDGHVLVMSRGSTKLEDGWCYTREVPVPVLGTFWAFVADKNSEVDFVKAGFVKMKVTRSCLTFEEIIQSNIGKRATIVEQPGDVGPVSHEGTLLGILQHESKQEVETSRRLPAGYNEWGRRISSQQIRETKEEEIKSLASFVMVQTDAGVHMIKRKNIRSIILMDKKPATTHTETKKVREISMHVARKGKPFKRESKVGMIYLQKGIRWIPDYRVQLLDNRKANVSLQGTIINDLADLEDVNLRLVVGVPSFIMKESLSPMALREIRLRLSSYFAPPVRGGRGIQVDYLSNVIMSQAALSVAPSGGPTVGGPDIPSEGQQEDLFLYHKPKVTLRKGERAVVKLLETTVPYEDIYTWVIPPIPPREMWRHVNQDQQRQMLNALTGAKAMHEIRLTNTGDTPWTTGPATIFKKGTALGQQLLTYTSVKNKVDVSVTIATDLNTKKEEAEVSRKPNIRISGDDYTKVLLHGKLMVTNFKDRPVHIYITRKVLGAATAATANGKIVLSNVIEDTSLGRGGYPWYWWSWPWWWYGVNSISEITWETMIPKGESSTFEYDWYYYYRH